MKADGVGAAVTRGRRCAALFGTHLPPILKGGHLQVRRLDSRTVFDVVCARAEEAGLPATTPHDFRRSMISDLLEVVDISTVQRLAGHANGSTWDYPDLVDSRFDSK